MKDATSAPKRVARNEVMIDSTLGFHAGVAVEMPSTPRVDGYGCAQRAADHLPRPLRLAAGDDDVDLRWLEDPDDIVGLSLEARGVRLDAGNCARPHQVLNPLIVPV